MTSTGIGINKPDQPDDHLGAVDSAIADELTEPTRQIRSGLFITKSATTKTPVSAKPPIPLSDLVISSGIKFR